MRNDELKKVCQAYLELALNKDGGKYGRLVLALLGAIIEKDPKLVYLETLMSDENEAGTLRKAQRNLAIAGGMPGDLYDVIQRVSK